MPLALPGLAPGPLIVWRLGAVGILTHTATMAGSVLMALLLLAGCTGIGLGTVTRDRFDYTAAVEHALRWRRRHAPSGIGLWSA
jgi:hypothetical protein